jgi:hypothetical protein
MKASDIIKSFKLKNELNSKLWDNPNAENPELKNEVRNTLLEIANNFIDFVGLDIDVDDVTMTGSLSNYNWSDYSDVDLHILVDIKNSDMSDILKELFSAKQSVWNSIHDVTIKGYNVEIYVQDSNEPHYSTGIYSVMYDEWIEKPVKTSVILDDKKIMDKSQRWMTIIDGIQQKSFFKDPEETLKIIDRVKDKLKKFRRSGLESQGEFSYENLAFKFLRRNEYLKKLSDLKNNILDSTLSLDQ